MKARVTFRMFSLVEPFISDKHLSETDALSAPDSRLLALSSRQT